MKTKSPDDIKNWYGLNIDSLQPGDIILTTQRHIKSQIIRVLTAGPFSHAMMYLGDHSVLEAPGEGLRVRSRNTQRIFFESPSFCKVLRNKNLDIEDMQNLIFFIRIKVGTIYSLPEAKKVLLRPKGSPKEWNAQFCSRLVAQAYHESGIDLVENPHYCSPQDLNKSELLEEVPNSIRMIPSNEYDEFSIPSLSLLKMEKSTDYILDEVKKISGHDIQTFDQLSEFLIANPTYDKSFSEILDKSRYLSVWEIDTKENPWYYDYKLFDEKYPDLDFQNSFGKNRLNEESLQLKHQLITLETLTKLNSKAPLKYHVKMIELYKKLKHLSETRSEVWRLAANAT